MAAMAPAPTGLTSSARIWSEPLSLTHSRAPTTQTRSPCTARQRRAAEAGTATFISAARSRRVKKIHPPRDCMGRWTSPSIATRPTAATERAISPAKRTRVTRLGPAGSEGQRGRVIVARVATHCDTARPR